MNTSRIASNTVRLAAGGDSATRRETHSAYRTVGILHAMHQTQCGQRGAARRWKLKLLNHIDVGPFIIFSFMSDKCLVHTEIGLGTGLKLSRTVP